MRSRAFCWTWNNYTTESIARVEELAKTARYLIYGQEVGELGTPHLQGYVYYENARSLSATIKAFKGAHVIVASGGPLDNYRYCRKIREGDITPNAVWKEFGKIPEQGERVDLKELVSEVYNGKNTDDICLEKPMMYHMYGRTLKKVEELRLRKQFRTEMTEGVWFFGDTNTGKSHRTYVNFHPDTHFVLNLNDGGFWNGYVGQANVIITDFRGQIPYDELLRLVDKWPHTVKIKGESPFPFISKKIWISSSLPPEKVYNRRDSQDKIAQLYRRVKVFKCLDFDTEVVWGNNSAQTNEDDIYGEVDLKKFTS